MTKTLSTTNLTYLRELAQQALIEQHEPFSDLELFCTITTLQDTSIELARHLAYEVDTLKLGKYEFIISWLSPLHTAQQRSPAHLITKTLADICKVLLGLNPIPDTIISHYERVKIKR